MNFTIFMQVAPSCYSNKHRPAPTARPSCALVTTSEETPLALLPDPVVVGEEESGAETDGLDAEEPEEAEDSPTPPLAPVPKGGPRVAGVVWTPCSARRFSRSSKACLTLSFDFVVK